MRKQIRTGIACLGMLVGINGVAQANLIANGSFENGSYVGNDSFVTLYAAPDPSSASISSWTVVQGSIDWINNYWQPSNGTKSLDLAGLFQHGVIMSDSFGVEKDKTYRVQFDLAGNPDRPYPKSLVAVATADQSLESYNFTFVEPVGYSNSNMGWQTAYFDFVAGYSGPAELFFGDITGQLVNGERTDLNPDEAWGAALDNVSVDLAPVPEPSTLLLLAAGLTGLGFFRRKLRR